MIEFYTGKQQFLGSFVWKFLSSSTLNTWTISRSSYRSSRPEVFLGKGVLDICSKFTGKHPCQSAVSMKLQTNSIETTLLPGCSPVNLLRIFRTYFPKNISEGLLPSKHINFESNNVDCQRLSKLFQRWYLVENESWADVRWQSNVDATSIEFGWFNVVEPMLFQHWNLVEIKRWADICLLKLFQRWQNNVETTLKELRQFSVDEPMLFQRWYLVENESWINIFSTALFKRWENSTETTLSIAALICTDVHQKVAQKHNKIRFSSTKHIFYLYIKT